MVRHLKRSYIYLIFAFLYMPIAVLMVYSFNDARSRGMWGGFTLRWYVELFQDRTIMHSLYATLIIGASSAVLATIIGTMAAIGIHNSKGPAKKVIMNVTYLPVLNPEIVTAISLMLLFVFTRVRFGYLTLLLSHISFNFPYLILSVLPKLRQLNKHLYEAARTWLHAAAGFVEGDHPRDHAGHRYRTASGFYPVH